MSGKLVVALVLVLALVVVAAVAVQADGPVLWKMHCPRHYALSQVADTAGDGVHVLCVRAAEVKNTR